MRCFCRTPTSWLLIHKGEDFSRSDQMAVMAKEKEILAKVVPAYAQAAGRGSVELSTTPYYHPILPLICDTNDGSRVDARAAASDSPLPPA